MATPPTKSTYEHLRESLVRALRPSEDVEAQIEAGAVLIVFRAALEAEALRLLRSDFPERSYAHHTVSLAGMLADPVNDYAEPDAPSPVADESAAITDDDLFYLGGPS